MRERKNEENERKFKGVVCVCVCGVWRQDIYMS